MSTVYCAGGMSCCRSYCFQLPLSNVGGECPSCIESVNKEMELYTSYIHRPQEAMSSIVWYSKKVNVQPSWFTCCYSTTIGSKRVFSSQKFDLSPTNWYICCIFLLLTLFAFVVNQQIPVLTNSTVLVLKRQDLKQTIKKKNLLRLLQWMITDGSSTGLFASCLQPNSGNRYTQWLSVLYQCCWNQLCHFSTSEIYGCFLQSSLHG